MYVRLVVCCVCRLSRSRSLPPPRNNSNELNKRIGSAAIYDRSLSFRQSAAAMKRSHLFLWLTLLLLLLLCGRSQHPPFSVTRKILLSTKADLSASPNARLHQNVSHRHGRDSPVAVDGGQIDPRCGVEKRLVPTGPNPLHN